MRSEQAVPVSVPVCVDYDSALHVGDSDADARGQSQNFLLPDGRDYLNTR